MNIVHDIKNNDEDKIFLLALRGTDYACTGEPKSSQAPSGTLNRQPESRRLIPG